jgi:hypothetical protein
MRPLGSAQGLSAQGLSTQGLSTQGLGDGVRAIPLTNRADRDGIVFMHSLRGKMRLELSLAGESDGDHNV